MIAHILINPGRQTYVKMCEYSGYSRGSIARAKQAMVRASNISARHLATYT
jgi:hypothetical protein